MHKIPLSFFVEQRNHEPDQKSTPKKDQHYGAMQEKILCSNLVVHSKKHYVCSNPKLNYYFFTSLGTMCQLPVWALIHRQKKKKRKKNMCICNRWAMNEIICKQLSSSNIPKFCSKYLVSSFKSKILIFYNQIHILDLIL